MVRVPVLPTHKSLNIAQVYTASMFLIKISSSFKFLIERAMAREIARGRPSGTATIKRTTAITTVSATFYMSLLRVMLSSLRIELKKMKISLVTIIRAAASLANLLI